MLTNEKPVFVSDSQSQPCIILGERGAVHADQDLLGDQAAPGSLLQPGDCLRRAVRGDYTDLILIRSFSGRKHVMNNLYFTDVLILTSTWMVASTGSRVWRRLTPSWPLAPGTSRTWTRRWRTSSAGTATVTVTSGAEG